MKNEDNGYKAYKDLIHEQNRGLSLPRRMRTTVEYLSLFTQIPVVGRFLRRSFSIVDAAANRLRRQCDYTALYELLIHCLLDSTFRRQANYRWWYLMRFAVAVAQERQIHWLVRDPLLEENLIRLGNLGPRPLKGYDVAYSFVGYSLWLFERGDVLGAISVIKIAEQADATWGYPEYLHGWYGLFTTGVDSIEHFARAVHTDWSFLHRMKQDRACCAHPNVLHEVQKRTLVLK